MRAPSSRAQSSRVDVGIAPPPCEDSAYRLEGGKQAATYKWSFKASTTPSGLNKTAVADNLRKSFSNVTTGANDCGLPDRIGATHQYLGTSTRGPNCNIRDGHNVVGFGSLPNGVLAVTCFWFANGKITEADMKINNHEHWALSMATCHGDQVLLESTVTHEAGHVFGLDHVGERKHGQLTMSPYINGGCEDDEATLGRGDIRGLEALY